MRNKEMYELIKGRKGRVCTYKYDYEGIIQDTDDSIIVGALKIPKKNIAKIEMNTCCVEFETKSGCYGVVGL